MTWGGKFSLGLKIYVRKEHGDLGSGEQPAVESDVIRAAGLSEDFSSHLLIVEVLKALFVLKPTSFTWCSP